MIYEWSLTGMLNLSPEKRWCEIFLSKDECNCERTQMHSSQKKILFRSKTMRCLGCQHDAGYSKPQLVWGGILLSACPFWIRFCQLNFCLNFSNSFSINFQEKFLLTLLFGPSFFINFQDNFAPTLLFGTPVKYIWNSRHPGRSKVQKSRKSSGDNCQKILTNWLVRHHEFF